MLYRYVISRTNLVYCWFHHKGCSWQRKHWRHHRRQHYPDRLAGAAAMMTGLTLCLRLDRSINHPIGTHFIRSRFLTILDRFRLGLIFLGIKPRFFVQVSGYLQKRRFPFQISWSF